MSQYESKSRVKPRYNVCRDSFIFPIWKHGSMTYSCVYDIFFIPFLSDKSWEKSKKIKVSIFLDPMTDFSIHLKIELKSSSLKKFINSETLILFTSWFPAIPRNFSTAKTGKRVDDSF